MKIVEIKSSLLQQEGILFIRSAMKFTFKPS